MDHDLELIIPILEILEIEVSNILYNPGNTGGGRAAPGVRLRGLGLFLEYVPGISRYPGNIEI